MSEPCGDAHCPYCWRIQPPEEMDVWRCPTCELFVRRSDLVVGAPPRPLDGVHRHLCPSCAFPVAWEYSLPDSGPFLCPGCAATLTAAALVTQTAIDAHRNRSMGGPGYILFAAVMLGVILLTLVLARAWRTT